MTTGALVVVVAIAVGVPVVVGTVAWLVVRHLTRLPEAPDTGGPPGIDPQRTDETPVPPVAGRPRRTGRVDVPTVRALDPVSDSPVPESPTPENPVPESLVPEGPGSRRAAVAPSAHRLPPDLAAAAGTLVLVQLSEQFSAPCRASRAVLVDVAGECPGTGVREVDVSVRPALVERLDVRSTPTTLVVDGSGAELARVVGVPRRAALLETVRGLEPKGSADRRTR